MGRAPPSFVACGRTPDRDYLMGANRVGFTNFGEGIQLVDTYSGALREPTKKDVGDSALMVDALDDVDVYERTLGAHEVPQEVAALHNADGHPAPATPLGDHAAEVTREGDDRTAAVNGVRGSGAFIGRCTSGQRNGREHDGPRRAPEWDRGCFH